MHPKTEQILMRTLFVLLPGIVIGSLCALIVAPEFGIAMFFGTVWVGLMVTERKPERGE